MPSTYSSNLRLELIGTGEQAGTWGTTTNTNLGTLIEQAIAGYVTVTILDTDYTLTANNGASDQARSMGLNIVSSVTLTATRNVICPSVSKLYVVRNATTGGQSIVIKTSAGSGITVANGATAIVLCNGTDVIDPFSAKQAALGYTPVNKAGDTMTGQLTLPGGGTGSQAATVSQITAAQAGAVAKAGDTMTGLLILSANPAVALGAATKQYVDSAVAGGGLGYTPVNKAGDTMTGLLTLSADPSTALQAATKQYVDTGLATKQASLGYTPVNKAGDTMTGNLAFSGTGLRVQGDFSNATVTNRTSFQDSTTNNTTSIGALPNGTATTSGWVAFNNSTPTNAGYAALLGTSSEVQIISNATGSGTVVNLGVYVGSTIRFRIQTDGAFIFYNNAGTRTASLDASGNFTVLGNVTAYGTP